jgi:hypothetical protein
MSGSKAQEGSTIIIFPWVEIEVLTLLVAAESWHDSGYDDRWPEQCRHRRRTCQILRFGVAEVLCLNLVEQTANGICTLCNVLTARYGTILLCPFQMKIVSRQKTLVRRRYINSIQKL